LTAPPPEPDSPDSPGTDPPSRASLRARAEARLAASRADIARMPPEDVETLVQELQVHQVELKIQNEELQKSHLQLAESRDRFADLYEFAPVGYLTLDAHGAIVQCNLAADEMLATERRDLVEKQLSDFVEPDDQDRFYLHRQAVFAGDDRQTVEIPVKLPDGCSRVFRLESRRFQEDDPDGRQLCRTALVDVTAQHHAEEELRGLTESLERRVEERTHELRRMSKVFMDAADPILLQDLDGTIREVNAEMERLYGWSREELVGKPITTIVPEKNHSRAEELLERCARGGSVRNVEGQCRTKSGEVIPILLTLSLLSGEDGESSGIASIAKDLRALKQTEADLRESRAIAEMHRDIAYMANMARNLEEAFAFCLEKVASYNGWIFGHAWFPSVSNPDILLPAAEHYAADPEHFAAFREATRSLEVPRGEGLPGRVYASGKAEWINDVCGNHSLRATAAAEVGIKTAAAFPVLVGDKAMGVFEFFSDKEIEINARIEESMAAIGAQLGRVIERSEAERNLKESEARLRQLTEHLRDVVWMHDADSFELVYCNAAFETIFGRPREVLEKDPRAFLESVHEKDRERVAEAIRKLETGEEDLDEEYRIRKTGGKIRWVRDRGYAVRNEAGEIYRFVGTAEDISERKGAERELKRLEREIGEAAEEERRRIARDLHDGLGGLLSAIDLRHQILADLVSMGEMPDPAAAEMVSGMIREGIAETRRLTRGLQPIGEDPEDLMSALRDLTGNIRAHAAITCRFLCPEPVLVHDGRTANELFRIAQEAANNAVKHSGASHLTLGLKRKRSEFVLSVKDNGTGFDPEKKSSGVGGKGGFGLEIMNHRARSIGGRLEIGPRKKKGVRVVCRVPVAPAESA